MVLFHTIWAQKGSLEVGCCRSPAGPAWMAARESLGSPVLTMVRMRCGQPEAFPGMALWNRWGEDDKTEGLYLTLDGSAANYVYSEPRCEAATFGELCHMLEARYGAAKSAAIDRKALRERRKEKGETYADLGQEILRLARRVYKT